MLFRIHEFTHGNALIVEQIFLAAADTELSAVRAFARCEQRNPHAMMYVTNNATANRLGDVQIVEATPLREYTFSQFEAWRRQHEGVTHVRCLDVKG